MNIYRNKNLKYPLTEEEYEKIDNIWEFNNKFKFITPTYHEYRNKLVTKIPQLYSKEEFYLYEKCIEKLYWNLHNEINKNENKIEEYNYDEIGKVHEKFYEECNFRSYINKVINYDDINKKIYYCKQEGGEPVSNYNKINHILHVIMGNRKIYEKVMVGEIDINKLELSNIYRQTDYGFPNFNIHVPFVGTEDWRKNKINHMYYDKGENNWFILLKPK